MKTDTDWIAVEEFGSYYRLRDGKLIQSPMNADGSRSVGEETEATDFDEAGDPDKIHRQIESASNVKP